MSRKPPTKRRLPRPAPRRPAEGFPVLIENIRVAIEAEHEAIAVTVKDGQCGDFAAYRDLTGHMRGLRGAADIMRREYAAWLGEDDAEDKDATRSDRA